MQLSDASVGWLAIVQLGACGRVPTIVQFRMHSYRGRPASRRTPSYSGALLLFALAGCGRFGLELLPTAVDDRGAPDVGSPEKDAGVDDGDSVPSEPDAEASASGDASTDAAAQGTADGSAGEDASTDARTNVDASTIADASLDAGANPTADAGTSVDAGTPGMRIVVDNSSSTSALRNFPVQIQIDTRSLIAAGTLNADCSNLRIHGGSGCGAARSFFLPDYACNSSATEIWVLVPDLVAGEREVLSVTFDGAGSGSDGAQVFPFFDDFEGSAIDTTRWIARAQGNASVSVSGGVLSSQGIFILESVSKAVSAGQSVVGVRMAASSELNTDVELGVGTIDDSVPLLVWAYARTWDGLTFVSHDDTIYAFDGPSGSSCDHLNDGSPPASLGNPWVDHAPATASFLTAEFTYANRSNLTEASLRTSRGASFSYTSPTGCTLPTSLPVMISLDHDTNDTSPTQRVDYVYVRPSTSTEPTASVLSSSTLACGTAP